MFKKFICALSFVVFGAYFVSDAMATNSSSVSTTVSTTVPSPEIKTIKPSELKKMLAEGSADLIDVRNTDEFIEKHIKGAKNIPLPILSADQLIMTKGKVVTQCKSGKRGGEAYLKLKKMNPNVEVYNLEGGIIAWEKEKFDTVSISDKLPIMRQVQIIAGSLVVAGTIIGIGANAAFLLFPIFVGLGLVIAGVTGWCGMAKLLAYMPWN